MHMVALGDGGQGSHSLGLSQCTLLLRCGGRLLLGRSEPSLERTSGVAVPIVEILGEKLVSTNV